MSLPSDFFLISENGSGNWFAVCEGDEIKNEKKQIKTR